MCGICGELRFDGRSADMAAVARMSERLRPRGPDHEGSYSDGGLGFGHRRLSIIDLSEKANQPMIDPQLGLALVFNGTLYNYPELRRQLKARGHRFFSDGDTEVILKAYREWGRDCLNRLHGMFAIAIWDMREKTLLLARDRFGIKPLYWSLNRQRLRFASNPQALLAGGGVDTSIDAQALHFQFTLHGVVPAPRTVLAGVRKLEPGCWMQFNADGGQQQGRYWLLKARTDPEPSEQDWVESVHAALLEAVRKRNDIADVPVGVLLSGGLDSSLLVALLAEIGHPKVHTFTIGFEDQPEEIGNEFEYSDQVVERYAPRHHKFLVPNADVLKRLPEAVDAMSEPMFGQDAVAFYLLSEQVSKSVKVVQSGQGADEVFGGYFWYQRIIEDRQGRCDERLRRYYFDRDHPEYLNMVQSAWQGEDYTGDFIRQALEQGDASECIDAVLRLDASTLIVDDPVKRVDNMTMAWGLEARVPFLDHQLVELAARCPAAIKFKNGDSKYLLKQVARGRVPDAVIDRPKGYFPMPALKYVRGEFLQFMRDILDSQAARERGVFQRSYIDRLLSAPEMHHTRIQGSKLWQLALFELWMQRQVDGNR